MVLLANVVSGLAIGLIFGVALQRGRFCFNSAFRDALLFKDFTILKAIGVAIAVEMIGFQLLSDLHFLQLYPRGLYWGTNIIGGFVFGVGMVLAGGCISGSTYRTGEGMVGSMLAVVGIAVGAAALLSHPLASQVRLLQVGTEIQVNGVAPTVPLELGLSPWVIIVPVVALLAFFAQRSYRKLGRTNGGTSAPRSWPWWFSGVFVGAVVIVSYPVAEAAGLTTPLAMTGGYVGILAALLDWNLRYINWEQTMVLGGILGAAIAAVIAKEWKLRMPPPRMLAQSTVGGLIMGIGAVLGDGCNITTILIGIPLLSLGGILAGTFTILGCWTAAYLMFR